ncbi:hypothetical protein [Desulforudis sp. DRI-14]|uniref:hypothetical protein n=1 Tax=Desulforudis sp. DRI-14 TaxID=3459793 RepID=UPI004041327B
MEVWFPIISVSLAVIDSVGTESSLEIRRLSEKAAQLKYYAKSIKGSIYVRDRRKQC